MKFIPKVVYDIGYNYIKFEYTGYLIYTHKNLFCTRFFILLSHCKTMCIVVFIVYLE